MIGIDKMFRLQSNSANYNSETFFIFQARDSKAIELVLYPQLIHFHFKTFEYINLISSYTSKR